MDMNQTAELHDNEAWKKYDGKTIRIKRYVYTIRVYESTIRVYEDDFNSIKVELFPKGNGGDSVTNDLDLNCYAYTNGGRVFRAATLKAKEIAREIEESYKVDIET
jgi:hypothetical protein